MNIGKEYTLILQLSYCIRTGIVKQFVQRKLNCIFAK